MKRIIALVSVFVFFMQFCVSAQVELNESGNFVEGVIRGKIASQLSDEAVLLHIKDGNQSTVHIDERYSATDGAYEFAFQINPDLGGGKYTYTVSTFDTTEETGVICVQDIATLRDLCEVMETAQSAEAIKPIFDGLQYYTANPIYDSLDKSRFYQLFYDEAKTITGLDVQKTVEIIEKIIFTQTANQNQLALITNPDGTLKSLVNLGLSEQDMSYYHSIQENGLKNINQHLQGKAFRTVSELVQALKGLIYVNHITHNTSVGVGNAAQIITEKASILGIDVSSYQSLAVPLQEEVLRTLVNSTAGSVSEFQNLFQQTVGNYSAGIVVPPVIVPSGGGGGGGGSYLPSAPVTAAPIQPVNPYDSGFWDMQGYDWAQEAVSILKDNKIINGKTETTFAPSDSVTREEYLAMLLRAVPVQTVGESAEGPYAWIKGDGFDEKTVNLWTHTDNGVSYENGMMQIASSGKPVMQIKRYDSSNVLSVLTGDSADAASAYAEYKIAMQTKMTVLSGEEGYTELALLDGDQNTKVHLVRVQRDGENTFKVLINQSSAGVNSGISNEVLSGIPYGQMVDVSLLIQENVVEFYINGEKAGATKYSTGIPTWSSGIKLYSDEGMAATPFVGAFDDMAVYFHKGTEFPKFTATEAGISDGILQLQFSTQPSAFSNWSILVNGEEKAYTINPITATLEMDYPENGLAKVTIVNGGKDIFGSFYDGASELQASMKNNNKEVSFADVKETDWYCETVKQAVNYQIVNGISPTVFGAGNPVTRQDMAVMAFRMLRYCNAILDTNVEGISFADDASIADYAKEYVKLLKKAGIINGYADGSFQPYGTANRAEAAQIVYQLYKLCHTK